ncbi:MAG: Gfo/Idh/MocA family protein [Allorhizobium sp.]
MTYFDVVTDDRPLRVGLVGAGLMGRNWLQLLHDDPAVELVGVVDLDLSVAEEAVASLGTADLELTRSIAELASKTHLDAIVNVTVPGAHHSTNLEALGLGLPVLCEKPVVPTVGEALHLAAAAQGARRLLMTSQSRRYNDTLDQFQQMIGTVGEVGSLTCEFHTGPHFGGFRESMAHPLLLDMAIHAFDCARFILKSEPISVYTDEFNPSWSWYDGSAAAITVFEMAGGTRFVYNGSWCNVGESTSWNGSWIARGASGSARWDGEASPHRESGESASAPAEPSMPSPQKPQGIAGALAEFTASLRSGIRPSGDIHSNVWTLGMVQAAVESAESGARVHLETLLADAYTAALRLAEDPAVRARLTAWGSAREALASVAN